MRLLRTYALLGWFHAISCSPCANDIERCVDHTSISFSDREWAPGDYQVHFRFPGYAAKCEFTVPEIPTTDFENFTRCETDTEFADEPATDPLKTDLWHLFNDDGFTVGVSAIVIDDQIAADYIRVVVVRDGEIVVDQEIAEIVSEEQGDECKTCDARGVNLQFP